MATANPGNIFILYHFDSRGTQMRSERSIIAASHRRMRLLRRTKSGFHSQMKLHITTGKPATTALRQIHGLGNFRHAEHAAIKARACSSSPEGIASCTWSIALKGSSFMLTC